jgi:hypothetical protein
MLAVRALMLSLFIVPTVAGAKLPEGMLEDTVAFDRALIPALFHAYNGQVERTGEALREAWKHWDHIATQYADGPKRDEFWVHDFTRIEDRLRRAQVGLTAGSTKMAYVDLGVIPGILLEIRQRHNQKHYVDGLAPFYGVLQGIVRRLERRPLDRMDLRDLDTLRSSSDAARYRWVEATAVPPDAALFGLDEAALDQVEVMEARVREALDALEGALSVKDGVRAKESALAAQLRFWDLYKSFGNFETPDGGEGEDHGSE